VAIRRELGFPIDEKVLSDLMEETSKYAAETLRKVAEIARKDMQDALDKLQGEKPKDDPKELAT